MTTLTNKEQTVYDFILSHRKECGTLPSKREIQRHFGYKSFNSAKLFIKNLVDKGRLVFCSNNVGYKIAE